MDNGLGPRTALDGSEWPPLVQQTRHPWQPTDDDMPVEEVALRSLEAKLADVRRLLLHAGRIRGPYRAEVRALAVLARDLHHAVLGAVCRP